jgi:REP element-mobilizing transposase RayT
MPQSFASLHCHVIFSTKHRAALLSAALQPRLFAYLGGILHDADSVLVAAGGMPDHVHLLVSLGREVSVAEVARLVKANSSKWVRETFPELGGFAWQNGYGAFAVSYSLVDRVKAYIAGQAEHHRTMTFQGEFATFLKRHGIAYDERYVWE